MPSLFHLRICIGGRACRAGALGLGRRRTWPSRMGGQWTWVGSGICPILRCIRESYRVEIHYTEMDQLLNYIQLTSSKSWIGSLFISRLSTMIVIIGKLTEVDWAIADWMKVFIVRLHLRLRLLLCMQFQFALVWIYPVTHDMGRKIRILDSGAEFAFVTKVPTHTGEDFRRICWYRRPELFTPWTC